MCAYCRQRHSRRAARVPFWSLTMYFAYRAGLFQQNEFAAFGDVDDGFLIGIETDFLAIGR